MLKLLSPAPTSLFRKHFFGTEESYLLFEKKKSVLSHSVNVDDQRGRLWVISWPRTPAQTGKRSVALWVGFSVQDNVGKPSDKDQAYADLVKRASLLNTNVLLGRQFSVDNTSDIKTLSAGSEQVPKREGVPEEE